MLVELGLGCIAYSGYKTIKYRHYIIAQRLFKKTCEVKKKDFYILETRLTDYGFEFVISLKDREFKDLESLQDILQNNFKAKVEIKQNLNYCTATVTIIKKRITNDMKFEPYETKPHELYFGMDNTFKPIVVSMHQYPHILISGATGSGKSQELKSILTNLIANNTDRDVNLYFTNISKSNDFKNFLRCKQTKSYVEDINSTLKMFECLDHLYEKRLEIFKKYDVDDIKQYNKRFKERRMAISYIVIDEFADYYSSNKLDKEHEVKVMCYNLLKEGLRKYRKVGIFYLLALQRGDNSVIDPSLKSNICTRVNFAATNNASSLVLCDSNELVGIEPREFMCTYGSNKLWSKSLYIDDCIIKECIKESVDEHQLNTFLSRNKAHKKPVEEGKSSSKVKNIKTRKAKAKAEAEVATTGTRVKNIEVIEVKSSDYKIENGKILLSISKLV